MTRKALPRAIAPKIDVLREGGASDDARRRRATPVGQRVLTPVPDSEVASLPRKDASKTESPSPTSAAGVGETPPASPVDTDPQSEKRRATAQKIVDRHKMYAALGGLLPLPIINVAGVTAIIVRMMKALSDHYQVPFERDRTRSLVMGLMGGAVPSGLAAAATSTLAVVPGGALVGLAVSSVSAAAFTRGIGLVFIEHFESTIAKQTVG